MPDIKIKGYSGVELPFADVPKVWLAAPESTADNPVLVPYTYGEALDGVEVEPDFSGGDMQVTVPEGYLLRSGVLKKPENLIPGNIKAGETVAGIPGEYEGETVELEEVTVALAMANGDQVIEPSEGKALGKVTLTKPETLVPENIAEGVDIAGIIGTLAAGGCTARTGQIIGTGETVTINHGLGTVPDVVIIGTADRKVLINNYYLFFAVGLSSKLANMYNICRQVGVSEVFYQASSFNVKYNFGPTTGRDIENTSYLNIRNADSEKFSVGFIDDYYMGNGLTYTWIAISGLT